MTRAIVCIGILLVTLYAGTLKGQHEQRLRLKADSLDKQTISKSLLTVRDSLNTYRALLTQKKEDIKTDQQIRRRFTTALLELNRSKEKLDAVIAEVAASKTGTWYTALHDKAYTTLRDARRDFKKIREDVKDLVPTSS
jgi:hypothetical protein